MKIAWCLLFALSLIVYAAFSFGAASGGSNNPSMMIAIWLAVAVGLLCGLATIAGYFAGYPATALRALVPIISLWPMLYVGVAILRSIYR